MAHAGRGVVAQRKQISLSLSQEAVIIFQGKVSQRGFCFVHTILIICVIPEKRETVCVCPALALGVRTDQAYTLLSLLNFVM